MKMGKCHQRYLERSKKYAEITMHPGEEDHDEPSNIVKPAQVFLL